jgi:hypothetical protein
VCLAAEIPRLGSRFVDGLLPLACGQSVHNCSMRTTARGLGPTLTPRAQSQTRRRHDPAGFSFAFAGRVQLLMLFRQMLWSCGRFPGPKISGANHIQLAAAVQYCSLS